MAYQTLVRIDKANILLKAVSKISPTARYSNCLRLYSIEAFSSTPAVDNQLQKPLVHKVHKSAITEYPVTKVPLPTNYEDIDDAEKCRFSPERSRDISGPVIEAKTTDEFKNDEGNVSEKMGKSDPRTESYDCTGTVSLNSAMQTNVPDPFFPTSTSTHFNMPGGQWSQGEKYMAEDLRKSHYQNVTRSEGTGKQVA